MFKRIQQFNIGGAWVYVAQFDETVEVKEVLPSIRQQAIKQCADEMHKRQRYCVWQLLDYALRERIGRGVDELAFYVDGNGKWSCDGGVHFSLSHCRNVVAVAVSEQPVGVDVEALDVERFNARLAERILTARELSLYKGVTQEQQSQMLASTWAQKESLFKRDGGKCFLPNMIDAVFEGAHCQTFSFGGVDFIVAVAINVNT